MDDRRRSGGHAADTAGTLQHMTNELLETHGMLKIRRASRLADAARRSSFGLQHDDLSDLFSMVFDETAVSVNVSDECGPRGGVENSPFSHSSASHSSYHYAREEDPRTTDSPYSASASSSPAPYAPQSPHAPFEQYGSSSYEPEHLRQRGHAQMQSSAIDQTRALGARHEQQQQQQQQRADQPSRVAQPFGYAALREQEKQKRDSGEAAAAPVQVVQDEEAAQIAAAAATGSGRWHEIANPNVPTGENSSLEVFLSYCRYYRDSTNPNKAFVDARGILSRACFEEWLGTRQRALKRPEESFRKTVTAHTQGTDGRKAFPPEVEKSMLVELRKQTVWPCFKDRVYPNGERINIGLQGFRGLGYHEKKEAPDLARKQKKVGGAKSTKPKTADLFPAQAAAAAAQLDASDNDAQSGSGAAKRKRVKQFSGDSEPTGEERGQERVISNMHEWRRNPSLIRLTADKLQVPYDELFGSNPKFKDVFDSDSVDHVLHVLGQEVKPRTIRAAVLVVMTRFFKPHQFLSLMSICSAMNQENIFSQDVLGLDLSIRDIRFDPKFLLPKEGMLPDLPVAQNIFCLNTYMYISADANSREMLEGSVLGSLPQQYVHPLQFWMIVLHVMPRLMQTGELLWQVLSTTMRGRPIITRTLYKIVGSTIQTTFQDVTHLYPEIMALPPLDEVVEAFIAQRRLGI